MKRKFNAKEKLSILEEASQEGVTISEVCRRHGVASSLFYKWQRQANDGALSGLSGKSGRKQGYSEEERLSEELKKKDSIIAELTARLIEEKKRF